MSYSIPSILPTSTGRTSFAKHPGLITVHKMAFIPGTLDQQDRDVILHQQFSSGFIAIATQAVGLAMGGHVVNTCTNSNGLYYAQSMHSSGCQDRSKGCIVFACDVRQESVQFVHRLLESLRCTYEYKVYYVEREGYFPCFYLTLMPEKDNRMGEWAYRNC
jgi:hypothetical protein